MTYPATPPNHKKDQQHTIDIGTHGMSDLRSQPRLSPALPPARATSALSIHSD